MIDANCAVAALTYVASTWTATRQMLTDQIPSSPAAGRDQIPSSLAGWLRRSSWPKAQANEAALESVDELYEKFLSRIVECVNRSVDLDLQLAAAGAAMAAAWYSSGEEVSSASRIFCIVYLLGIAQAG